MSDTPAARAGTLFVIALPIGNIEDISYRAVRLLREVDLIAAEDTRHLEKYRRAYGFETPAISVYEYNEAWRSEQLVARLLAGEQVALVSDAGTPLVNDPGYRLVRAALAHGIAVTSVPGACAAVVALAVSGLSPAEFRFVGFPPRTGGKRRSWLARLRDDPSTLILYEAPHRLLASLTDARDILGDRAACLARSITKADEAYVRGTLGEIVALLAAEERVRGEATVIISGVAGTGANARDEDANEALAEAVGRMAADGPRTSEIVERLMADAGLPRREAYRLALAARESERGEDGDG